MTRITIVTLGTRGDVQPYVALGVGLRQAGFQIRIATHENFRVLIEKSGLDFAPIAGNAVELVERTMRTSRNPIGYLYALSAFLHPILDEALDNIWSACQNTDAIVYSALGIPAHHIAEKLQIPAIRALLVPLTRTHEFPDISSPGAGSTDRTYNMVSHIAAEQFIHQYSRVLLARWRRSLGLPPSPLIKWPYDEIEGRPVPVLYGYSPTVIPRPADWEEHINVTGFWFLDTDQSWQPPRSLESFLAAGPPPVSIGFGSLATGDFAELKDVVLSGLAKIGQRGILLTGWAHLDNTVLPESVIAIDSVPHDWLFQRVAAVVHHGGAGTTAAAMRAGVPAVVVPFTWDQPFWGRRVHELGVGPEPIPLETLSSDGLASAIDIAINDDALRSRAARLGETIRSEHGVDEAVKIISRRLKTMHSAELHQGA